MRAGAKPYNFVQDHCDVPDCAKKHRAGGYCAAHYSRVIKYDSIYSPIERNAHEVERNRIIKYLLDMKIIREGMLGGEYVAMDTSGENAVSLSTTLGGK